MNPIGAHMSIVGGPSKAFQRIQAVGGECFQIFVKPSVQWQAGEHTRVSAMICIVIYKTSMF